MVNLGLPVVALIEDFVTCCGKSSSCCSRSRGETESGATNNSVDMRRQSTRRYDGIASVLSQGSAVDSEQLSLDSSGGGQGGQGRLLDSHDVSVKARLLWLLDDSKRIEAED